MQKNKSQLHNYQLETVEKIKALKKCALFFDMSLGKTITTLTALSELLWLDLIKKVLIVAPLRVANTVWRQETLKWEHTEWLSHHINICTGIEEQRKKALKLDHKILITNRDNLQWFNINNKNKYDMVIIDESSSFKNKETTRYQMVRPLCIGAEYLVLLTGTPSPNSLLELWSQIFLIDQGERLGKTLHSYTKKFFYRTGYEGHELVIRSGMQTQIKKLLEDICITLRAKDYIELPDKIVSNQYGELDIKNQSIYRRMEKDFIVELSNEEQRIIAINAAAKIGKLLQFCNGFMYDDEKCAHEFHQIKIDILKDILKEHPNENILIAYNFHYDFEMLQKAFPEATVMDKKGEVIRDWNEGKIKLLLAHPASAGHGLNLQAGGSIVVWYAMTWSLENYLQFNARLHRQGQLKPVKIIHLLIKNTIDEHVLKVLENKDITQSNFIDSLRLRLLESNCNA